MPIQALIRYFMQCQDRFRDLINIIFDLDGTLIDSAPSILRCLEISLKMKGYLPLVDLNRSLIGPPLNDIFKLLTNEDEDRKIAELIEEFKFQYDSVLCKHARPYDGIHNLLLGLKKAKKNIYIVTNKRYKPSKLIIDHNNWAEIFDDIYSIDHPEVIFKEKVQVMRQLIIDKGLNKHRSCYIGDRAEDFEAAKANSIPFIYVEWGYGLDQSDLLFNQASKSPLQLRKILVGE